MFALGQTFKFSKSRWKRLITFSISNKHITVSVKKHNLLIHLFDDAVGVNIFFSKNMVPI
jgi:hypothetical protein